jgi:hypothetical protein
VKKTYKKTRESARIKRGILKDNLDKVGNRSNIVFLILSLLLTIIAGLDNTNHLKTLLSLLWLN